MHRTVALMTKSSCFLCGTIIACTTLDLVSLIRSTVNGVSSLSGQPSWSHAVRAPTSVLRVNGFVHCALQVWRLRYLINFWRYSFLTHPLILRVNLHLVHNISFHLIHLVVQASSSGPPLQSPCRLRTSNTRHAMPSRLNFQVLQCFPVSHTH